MLCGYPQMSTLSSPALLEEVDEHLFNDLAVYKMSLSAAQYIHSKVILSLLALEDPCHSWSLGRELTASINVYQVLPLGWRAEVPNSQFRRAWHSSFASSIFCTGGTIVADWSVEVITSLSS